MFVLTITVFLLSSGEALRNSRGNDSVGDANIVVKEKAGWWWMGDDVRKVAKKDELGVDEKIELQNDVMTKEDDSRGSASSILLSQIDQGKGTGEQSFKDGWEHQEGGRAGSLKESGDAMDFSIRGTQAKAKDLTVKTSLSQCQKLLHRSLGEDKSYAASTKCSTLMFDWDEKKPYTTEQSNAGIKPYTVRKGCDETQRCLFMPDVEVFNIMAAASGSAFPLFQNILSDRSPSAEQVMANSMLVFDEHSSEYIHGIGTYYGPVGIGEYKVIPQFLMELAAMETRLVATPSNFKVQLHVEANESWMPLSRNFSTSWLTEFYHYPCSIMHHKEKLEFPSETAVAFSDAGKVEGTVESFCQVVMEHCIGELQQYESMDDCVSYLSLLPHHDSACQEKLGPYTTIGDSFMCKYLHHFMIPLSPATHCAHTGKGMMADDAGNYKCVPADCEDVTASEASKKKLDPSCSATDAEELAQGIIYALPFCLPSLEMQVCTPNCTQAINTYLGRFAESGAIDACDHEAVMSSSRLLSLVKVDAQVLYHVCSEEHMLASHVKVESDNDDPRCSAPNGYLGSGLKCYGWDWDNIANGIFDEWSNKYQDLRSTKSDSVATAECFVFTQLYAYHLNVESRKVPGIAAINTQSDIQIHPHGQPLILRHADVSSVLGGDQVREGIGGIIATHCTIPGKNVPWLQDLRLAPFVENTSSPIHTSERKLIFSWLPGLTADKVTPPPPNADVFDARGLLGYEELLLTMGEEIFAALLLRYDSTGSHESFWADDDLANDVRDATKLSVAWIFPESLHRAQGYLLGTGYISKRQSIARKLKAYLQPDDMERRLIAAGPSAAGLRDRTDIDSAYGAMVDAVFGGTLSLTMVAGLISFIHRDPCRLLPMWEKSPERFIIEYTRLFSFAEGFSTATQADNTVRRYLMASAHRDPTIFPDPDEFDPDRDLGQVLAWNFLEGAGWNSHARACPGRSFAVQFMKTHAPRYFPTNVQCANEFRVYNGVEFYQEYSPSTGDIIKTSTGGDTLILFLHGFPDVPLEFATIISHLQGSIMSTDYWIVDGWSAVEGASCKLDDYASRVAVFIESVKINYYKIFLVGHDFGGMVGWRVSEMLGKDVLAGFATFSPRPQIFGKALRTMSASDVPFTKLMGPLIGSTFLAANDFKLLDEMMEDAPFWPEYRDEYHRVWEDAGAHTLTCVYRDNFDVVDSKVVPVDLGDTEEIETDVLVINGQDDAAFPAKLFHASVGTIRPHGSQQLFHREIYGASHHGVLHGASAKESADHIVMLVKSVQLKHLSLWSRLTKAPQIQNSYNENVSSTTTFYIYTLSFVVILTGIIMEVTVGPLLVGKMGFEVYLFAQVMAATINFGCFFAADLITLPLYTVGLFKFGYPEVTGKVLSPIKSPEFFYHSKPYRVLSFVSGLAYVVHHSGGTIVYIAISLHEMDPLSLGFVVLAVGFQHLVVFVKYSLPKIHALLLLGLEIWFQLEAYYALSFSTKSVKVGICMVLASHYVWFIHGIVTLVMELTLSSGDENAEGGPSRRLSTLAMFGSLRQVQRTTFLNQNEVQHLLGFDIDSDDNVNETQTPNHVADEEIARDDQGEGRVPMNDATQQSRKATFLIEDGKDLSGEEDVRIDEQAGIQMGSITMDAEDDTSAAAQGKHSEPSGEYLIRASF